MDFKHCVVLCTCPNENTAETIAKSIVEQRLAACTNIMPKIRSIFCWEQHLEFSPEVLLIIKTTLAIYPKLEQQIVSIHPYECPEIIALPILRGFPGYMNWMEEAVSDK